MANYIMDVSGAGDYRFKPRSINSIGNNETVAVKQSRFFLLSIVKKIAKRTKKNEPTRSKTCATHAKSSGVKETRPRTDDKDGRK